MFHLPVAARPLGAPECQGLCFVVSRAARELVLADVAWPICAAAMLFTWLGRTSGLAALSCGSKMPLATLDVKVLHVRAHPVGPPAL